VHIEVKNGFCAASALLRHATPAGTAHSLRAIADKAVADEIDLNVPVGRPMPLEIVENVGPVRFEAVRAPTLVVILGKPFDQPFGDATTGPVFARSVVELPRRAAMLDPLHRCASLLGLLLASQRLNNRCRHTGRRLTFTRQP
jgi:hypothetical protein